MADKPFGVQLTDEDKLYRRYWSGKKGEPMGVSVRQLQAKIDRMKRSANDMLRSIKRVEVPTGKQIKEGDFWDKETLEEIEEYLTECLQTMTTAEKEVLRLTKPFHTQARQIPWEVNKRVTCPKCEHEFGLKGNQNNE